MDSTWKRVFFRAQCNKDSTQRYKARTFSRWQILSTNSSGRFFYERLALLIKLCQISGLLFQGLKHEKSYSIFFLDTLCAYEKTRKIRYDVVSIHFWWKPQSISWAMSVLALDNFLLEKQLYSVACDQSWLFDMLVVSIFQKWNCAASICDCVPMVW